MSNEIVIDLTENMANAGKNVPFKGVFVPDYDLLPYPNAELVKVEVALDVVFTNPNVETRGTITCFIDGNCDRCLEKVSKAVSLDFAQIFYKDFADEDEYVYSNSLLNATKAICDEIVLSLPSLLLCKDDCKGLCPKCGTNLNVSTCSCDTGKENAFSALKNLKF